MVAMGAVKGEARARASICLTTWMHCSTHQMMAKNCNFR